MLGPMAYAEECVVLEWNKGTSDGMGGNTDNGWREKDYFMCLIAKAGSFDRLTAQQESNTGLFNITVYKTLGIPFGTVFRSNKTGRTYKVTQDPNDNPIPGIASFQVKVGQARLYELPEGGA